MLLVTVQGGTSAGVKKSLRPANAQDWICPNCRARNKHYWRNCPNCGERRPEHG